MPPPPPSPPVTLFPPAPKVTLKWNKKLADAIIAAVASVVASVGGGSAPFAVTIVELPEAPAAGGFPVAGFNELKEEHYAASLVKIAAMYAAHALLDMVKRFNTLRTPTSQEALFKALRAEMDGTIEGSSSLIQGGTSTSDPRVPHYEDIIRADKIGTKLSIRFQPRYEQHLANMIIPSSNAAAAACIHGVGYSYLNGLLDNHGFFKPADKLGVWLAGDYTGAWPYVRIPCDNDVDTAQGATSRTVTHLMAVIMQDTNLGADSHTAMIGLLKRSAHGPDPSWFLRKEVANRLNKNQVTHAKIGIGPLKKGRGDVYSEACVLSGVGARRYAVGFLNIDYKPYALDHVLAVVKDAIADYEKP